MSEFSNLLKAYVKTKGVKPYAMALYCNLDKSTMYKFMKGDRNPTNETVVEKIADFMRLSPVERKELIEAYQITTTGQDIYFRRKNVEDFFINFSNSGNDFPDTDINYTSFFTNATALPLKSKTEIENVIYSIIMLESHKISGYIKLLIQPDDDFIMKLLTFSGKKKKNLKIEHIICLNNSDSIVNSKQNYNLRCLKNIMPLYICDCNYDSYYYYENILSHSNLFNFSPYLIITSEYALTLSADWEYGIVYHNDDLMNYFNNLFDDLIQNAIRLGMRIDSLLTQINYFSDFDLSSIPGISFQIEPCLVPFLSQSMIDKYLIIDIPNRKETLNYINAYVNKLSSIHNSNITKFIFTQEGVLSFLNTGRLSEIPHHIYHSFSLQDRILLIRRLIHMCMNQNCRMLNLSMKYPDSRLSVYINQQRGCLLFTSITNNLVYLDLKEPSLLNSFYDFWDTLNDSYFYSKEETINFLNMQIKRCIPLIYK